MMAKPLLERTARAMYKADPALKRPPSPDFDALFDGLTAMDQLRYSKMATAALEVILREPVTELEVLGA